MTPGNTSTRGAQAQDRSTPTSADADRRTRIWRKAYAARTREDLLDLYGEWAATYDSDHVAIGFDGHERTARMLARRLPDRTSRILDAGAGTGAAGQALAGLGYEHVDALDLSAAMLEQARAKGVYRELHQGDLGEPQDCFANDTFDGALLVGVFSYGQAPAHAIGEVLRVVRPGGFLALTMREDFAEQDAMGVASRLRELEEAGALRLVERSEPAPYLPRKDPDAKYRVWVYEALAAKSPSPTPEFREAIADALTSAGPVKRVDHAFIWDRVASRLYEAYIRRPEYYLNECEEEILRVHADSIAERHAFFVELGCGSAKKVRHVLSAAIDHHPDGAVTYMPIDVSAGALEATCREIDAEIPGRVDLQPKHGTFDAVLSSIPGDQPKTILFFGSSIGNIETHEGTVAFLRSIRDRMTPLDRFLVGFDLRKDRDVLLRAYNAGHENRMFFVHMVRRINELLGARFDVDAFRLDSTVEEETPSHGLHPWRVNLRVTTERAQDVDVPGIDRRVHLDAGDSIQVGVSRKFRSDDVRILAGLAGLRVRTMWLDRQQYMALTEFVVEEAPVA